MGKLDYVLKVDGKEDGKILVETNEKPKHPAVFKAYCRKLSKIRNRRK